MASISANGSRGHHRFTLNVNETGTNAGANQSTVSFSLVLSPIQSGWDWNYTQTVPVKYSISINGNNYSGNIMSYNGSSTVTVRSGSLTVPHNADGSKTIGFSFSISSINRPILPGNASASGSLTLTKFQRKPSYNSVSASEIKRTSVRLKGSVNTNGLSITGGGWDVGKSTSSYTYHEGGPTDSTITGLTPNTKYYYRGYVITAGGGANSAWNNFTTSGNAPTLNSVTASSITRTTANLSISARYDTNASYKAVQYTYGTTSGSYPNSTDSTMSGLTPNTTYYIRARVQDNWNRWSGYKYTSFKTSGNAPTITSHGVQTYGQTTMIMQYAATYDTNSSLSSYRWDYTTGTLPSGATDPTALNTNTITGLTPNTTYNYRIVVVENQDKRTSSATGTFKTDYPTQEIVSIYTESVTQEEAVLKVQVPTNTSWITNLTYWIYNQDKTELISTFSTQTIDEMNTFIIENLEPGTQYVAEAQITTYAQSPSVGGYPSQVASTEFMTQTGDPIAIINSDGTITRHKLYVMGKGNIYKSHNMTWQNGYYATGTVGSPIGDFLTQASTTEGGAASTVDYIEILPNTSYTITNEEEDLDFIIQGTDSSNNITTVGYTVNPGQSYEYTGDINTTRLYVSLYSTTNPIINMSTASYYKMNVFRTYEKTQIPKDNIVYINGKIRYIDIIQSGNTVDNNGQVVELQVFNGDGENVALGKPIIVLKGLNGTNLNAITDGVISSDSYGQLEPFSVDDMQTIFRVDLGQEYTDIQRVSLWRYYADGRTYNDSAVYGRDATERLTWKFHSYKMQGQYQETAEGKTWDVSYEFHNELPIILGISLVPDNSQNTIIGTNIVVNAQVAVSIPPVLDSYISYRTDAILAANRGRLLKEEMGYLSTLTTIAKDNLVAAINEIYENYQQPTVYSNVLDALLDAPLRK